MSRIDDAVICTTLGEKVQWGDIYPGRVKYSINKVTLKRADGKRLTRYAVLINGKWSSSEHYKLPEAREYVRKLTEMFVRKMTVDAMRKLCDESGGEIALYKLTHGDPVKWVEYALIYNGAVVGSEYTTPDDVKSAVAKLRGLGT